MRRVVSHAEIDRIPEGGVLRVEADAIVTPLARERAQSRRVAIETGEAGAATPELIRQVTRQVVARLPGAPPATIETVVAEILGAVASDSGGGQRIQLGGTDAASIEVCAGCLESERARARARAVLTVTGRNSRGIAAAVTASLAELGADILDISQTLVADFFTMIVVFDTRTLEVPFDEARSRLEARLAELGMKATVMHEDVLASLHRV